VGAVLIAQIFLSVNFRENAQTFLDHHQKNKKTSHTKELLHVP